MKINNKEFLNPQQQLYENTKDIEKLKADYQPVYNSSIELYEDETAAESVLLSNTNAPEGTKNGWILDPNGYLFKITDGSTTTLLIQYYTHIQGAQGPQGETGATGATPNITVNASISDTTGTPSVTVTKTGTDENPTLSFAFSNLKGPQGDPGQTTIGIEVVAELPAIGEEGVIYFVPKADGETGDEYDEYTYTDGDWELLGSAQVDLTNYALKSEIPVINENLIPKTHYTYDLGASGLTYKDLWVGNIKNLYLDVSTAGVGGTQGNPNGVATIKTKSGNGTDQSTLSISNLGYSFSNTIYPGTTETIDLGKLNSKFKDLYLSGSLKDGTNSIAIADIAKTTDIPVINYPVTSVNGQTGAVTLSIPDAVSANPTLAGTESNLSGITIGSTSYKVSTFSGSYNDLTNKPSLATVATTGSYNDLANKPTIPSGTAASYDVGTSAGNIPILDANGKLSDSVLPALAISDTFVVNSQADMLALTAQVGDVCVRTDLNKSYILKTDGASTLANWQELLTPTDAVQSVNGQTGAVTITQADLNIVYSATQPSNPVTGMIWIAPAS